LNCLNKPKQDLGIPLAQSSPGESMKFSLYPIRWVADGVDDKKFDCSTLPLDIAEGVRIEDVSKRFREDEFDHFREDLGAKIIEKLLNVRYALVHTYEPSARIVNDKFHIIQHANDAVDEVRRASSSVRDARCAK